MIDFGFDKIALIGAVALIVIGPEKLPKVARTVGHLMGKAQRYVADVKAEVNRSIELEELQKMKTQFETPRATSSRPSAESTRLPAACSRAGTKPMPAWARTQRLATAPPGHPFRRIPAPAKNWRLKRGATPWYKQREGVQRHGLSGAARVARFRPPASGLK